MGPLGPMGPWAQKVIFGFRDFWIFEVLGPLGPLGTQAHMERMRIHNQIISKESSMVWAPWAPWDPGPAFMTVFMTFHFSGPKFHFLGPKFHFLGPCKVAVGCMQGNRVHAR